MEEEFKPASWQGNEDISGPNGSHTPSQPPVFSSHMSTENLLVDGNEMSEEKGQPIRPSLSPSRLSTSTSFSHSLSHNNGPRSPHTSSISPSGNNNGNTVGTGFSTSSSWNRPSFSSHISPSPTNKTNSPTRNSWSNTSPTATNNTQQQQRWVGAGQSKSLPSSKRNSKELESDTAQQYRSPHSHSPASPNSVVSLHSLSGTRRGGVHSVSPGSGETLSDTSAGLSPSSASRKSPSGRRERERTADDDLPYGVDGFKEGRKRIKSPSGSGYNSPSYTIPSSSSEPVNMYVGATPSPLGMPKSGHVGSGNSNVGGTGSRSQSPGWNTEFTFKNESNNGGVCVSALQKSRSASSSPRASPSPSSSSLSRTSLSRSRSAVANINLISKESLKGDIQSKSTSRTTLMSPSHSWSSRLNHSPVVGSTFVSGNNGGHGAKMTLDKNENNKSTSGNMSTSSSWKSLLQDGTCVDQDTSMDYEDTYGESSLERMLSNQPGFGGSSGMEEKRDERERERESESPFEDLDVGGPPPSSLPVLDVDLPASYRGRGSRRRGSVSAECDRPNLSLYQNRTRRPSMFVQTRDINPPSRSLPFSHSPKSPHSPTVASQLAPVLANPPSPKPSGIMTGLATALAPSFLFKSLPPKRVTAVLEASKRIEIAAGRVVYRQGMLCDV